MVRVGLPEKVPFGVFLLQTEETGGKNSKMNSCLACSRKSKAEKSRKGGHSKRNGGAGHVELVNNCQDF